MEIQVHGQATEEALELARASMAGGQLLRHVAAWAARHEPPLRMQDLVEQDEYSQDLLFELPDGSWLVYGAT